MRPEHHALATELTNIFQKSLRENASAEDCAELWKSSDATAKANRFLKVNSEAAEAFRVRRSPIAVINRPSLVHMFWLLGVDDNSVRQYLDILLDSDITRSFLHTKFWANYCRAIATFTGLAVNMEPMAKLKGYEKYWEPYLDFMAGNISRDEFTTRANESFVTRNGQTKHIDWENLDGDAKSPVKWDFRYASIQRKGGF